MQKALEALPGVAKVTPDTDREEVTCVVDPSKFDAKQAVATVVKLGYDGSKLIGPKAGHGKN